MGLKGGILFPDARFLSFLIRVYVYTSEGCIKIGRGDGLGPEQ